MKHRGQRLSTRKSGQAAARISCERGSWEEKFNLRLSKERVVAAFEGGDNERDGCGDNWVEQGDLEEEDGEQDCYKEEEEEEKKMNFKEDGEFEWRSENPLGDCDARLSEMVALMQKAGTRIQFGDSSLLDSDKVTD